MNIYIILILAIVISIMCIMQKKNIQETLINMKQLKHFGASPQRNNFRVTGGKKLGHCEGDCDNNNHCLPGLHCFQRKRFERVPGCKAGGKGDIKGHDYCYDPKFITKQLSKYKVPVNASESSGVIQLIGSKPVKPEKGKLINVKDSNGKDMVFTRDYTLKFDIYVNNSNAEPKKGRVWRSVFQRTTTTNNNIWAKHQMPGVLFFGSSNHNSRRLRIFVSANKHNNTRYTIDTPSLHENKWTTVKIQLKNNKFTVQLSGPRKWKRSRNVRSAGPDARRQYYYQNNWPALLYLGAPRSTASNCLVKNMTWENHRDKKCFVRMPTGCEKPMKELIRVSHSDYKTKDTGWIEGGWGWNGTDDGCNITRKKTFNNFCKRNDAMTIVQDSRPEKDVFGGWVGFNNTKSDSTNIIKMSKYPDCKKECEDNPECNNIRWTIKDKTCTLMRSAPEKNTDGGWAFSKLWKKISGWYKK